jgi:hypothetical protein
LSVRFIDDKSGLAQRSAASDRCGHFCRTRCAKLRN